MKVQFTIPLRIKGLRGDISSLDVQQRAHRAVQVKFHKTIQCIGDGNEDGENVILMNYDEVTHKRTILIPGSCHFCVLIYSQFFSFQRYNVHYEGRRGDAIFVPDRV